MPYEDSVEREKIRTKCIEREPAPCVSECRFSLDVREFIAKIKRGAIDSAMRLYSNAVAFPRVVSQTCGAPCAAKCPMSAAGGAVDLLALERTVVAGAAYIPPTKYNLPTKDKKIAVIGAGATGLACALRLANKKYRVTVFERADRIGGSLWDIMEPEIFLAEFEDRFKFEEYDLRLGTEIADASQLIGEYDAVCAAAGAENIKFSGDIDGLFLCEPDIASGLAAASAIDSYLRSGVMKRAEPKRPTRLTIDPRELERREYVAPSGGGLFTKEEAAAEASRCALCRCDACVRHCEMLRYYQKFPKLIEEEVYITVHPGTLDGNGTVATRLMASCSDCGLCREVCPERIDVGKFLREAREAMRAKGSLPEAFHDFWLREMDRADEASFLKLPEGGGPVRDLFFPGCRLGTSCPDYVIKPYEALVASEPGTALFSACCGTPAVRAGVPERSEAERERFARTLKELGSPRVIFGCPSCRRELADLAPNNISLFDALYDIGLRPKFSPIAGGASVTVFDPCSERGFEGAGDKTRAALAEAGYELVPTAHEGRLAACCSWGGHTSIANPPCADAELRGRAAESAAPYIVRCANCRDSFAAAGKEARHILDLVFGLNASDDEKSAPVPPTLSRRHRARAYIRSVIMDEPIKDEGTPLVMTEDVERKLSAERIADDDVRAVIERCERTGRKLRDEAGRSVGFAEIGNMTCWVEYEREDDKWRVHNAYAHRMKIELEEVWHGRKVE